MKMVFVWVVIGSFGFLAILAIYKVFFSKPVGFEGKSDRESPGGGQELVFEKGRGFKDFFDTEKDKWMRLFIAQIDVTNKGDKEVRLLQADPFVRSQRAGRLSRLFSELMRRLLFLDKTPKRRRFFRVIDINENLVSKEIDFFTFPLEGAIEELEEGQESSLTTRDRVKPGFEGISDLRFQVSPEDTESLTIGFIFDCFQDGEHKVVKEGVGALLFNFRLLFDNGRECEFYQAIENFG